MARPTRPGIVDRVSTPNLPPPPNTEPDAEDLRGLARGISRLFEIGARTLSEDGILHTFMRRDQLRFDGAGDGEGLGVGVARWAGTVRAEAVLQAFVPSLARAATGPAADRARARSHLLGLLAYGLGVAGSLEDLADLCVALVSHGGPLQVSRPLMPGLLIRAERADAPDRLSLTRLLRQLVWFRDLGLTCGAADLAVPWRELAHEARSEP